MKQSKIRYKETINVVQNDILNHSYISVILLTIPMIITSYLRIPVLGISPIIVMSILGSLFISSIYLFRERLSYKSRSYIIISSAYIIGVVDILSIGMMSMGATLLLAAFTLSAIFLAKKQVIGVGIICVGTFTLLGTLIQFHKISYFYNIVDYFYGKAAWNSQIVAFMMFSFTVVIAVSRLIDHTHQSALKLQRQNDEVVSLSSQVLTSEIALREKLGELENNRAYLRDSEKRYRTLIENSLDDVYAIDIDRRFVSVNKKFEQTVHQKREDIIGKTFEEVIGLKEPNEEWNNLIDRVITSKANASAINNRVLPDGRKYTYESALLPIKDDDGNVELIIGTNHDLTSVIQKEEAIAKLAYTDALTNLPNRKAMLEYINKVNIEDHGQTQFAFAYIDVDEFKKVNDTIGHHNGDELIVMISKKLSKSLSDAHIISRMAGDEFAIVYDVNDYLPDIKRFVGRIHSIFEEPFFIGEVPYHLTISMGITMYPNDGHTFEELLRNADTAMHEVKRSGRNDYRLFDYEMKHAIGQKIAMEKALRNAIKNNDIYVEYQPQYNQSGGVVSLEALMRWHSEAFGQVSPMIFIPLLEENGMIIRYGWWILDRALRDLKDLHDKGYKDLQMAVNISAYQLSDLKFADNVMHLLRDYHIKPECLELEVTESVLIDDFDHVSTVLNALNNEGVRIAIDDFGTGYSSLSYLQLLPITTLKIDKSFIDSVGEQGPNEVIVGSLIRLAHDMGLRVVAEGIETEAQKEYLDICDCDYQQGFYHCHPTKLEDILRFL